MQTDKLFPYELIKADMKVFLNYNKEKNN